MHGRRAADSDLEATPTLIPPRQTEPRAVSSLVRSQRVATVIEPAARILGGDGLHRVVDRGLQTLQGPCRAASKLILQFAPTGFDWVELRAVARQKQQLTSGCLDSLFDLRIFVRRQVIQDHYLPCFEHRNEHLLNESAEDRSIGEGPDGHQRTEPREGEGAQQRQPLIATCRSSTEGPMPLRSSCVEAAHTGGEAALVEKDQLLRSDLANGFLEGYALGRDVRLELFRGA
jgi:hypothetical protein